MEDEYENELSEARATVKASKSVIGDYLDQYDE